MSRCHHFSIFDYPENHMSEYLPAAARAKIQEIHDALGELAVRVELAADEQERICVLGEAVLLLSTEAGRAIARAEILTERVASLEKQLEFRDGPRSIRSVK